VAGSAQNLHKSLEEQQSVDGAGTCARFLGGHAAWGRLVSWREPAFLHLDPSQATTDVQLDEKGWAACQHVRLGSLYSHTPLLITLCAPFDAPLESSSVE